MTDQQPSINQQLREAIAGLPTHAEEYELLGLKFIITGITDNERVRRNVESIKAAKASLNSEPIEVRGKSIKGDSISDETWETAAFVCAAIEPMPALKLMAVIAKTHPKFWDLAGKVSTASEDALEANLDQAERQAAENPTDGDSSPPASTSADTIPTNCEELVTPSGNSSIS